MNESLPDLPWLVLRATCFLSIATALALAMFRHRARWSPGTKAAAWTMVLLSGVCIIPATVEIPWYPAAGNSAAEFGLVPDDVARPTGTQLSQQLTHAAKTHPPHVQRTRSWRAVLKTVYPAVWVVGTFATGGLFLAGYVGLLFAMRSTWRAQKSWQQEYDAVVASVGITAAPELLVHAHLGPFLCMTPRGQKLVIPGDQWSQLTAAERDIVLRHELGHYLRKDVWRTLPIRFVVLLHWFNPLSWLAARRVEESSECAADHFAVQNNTAGAGDLANALLKLAVQPSPSRLFASSARGRSLARRLKSLISYSEPSGAESMLRKVSVLAVMACVLIAGAVQIRLVAREADVAGGSLGAAAITQKAAAEFAAKIIGDDELTEKLKLGLHSEPGALVLRDRVGGYEAMARSEALASAIPELFAEAFEQADGKLKLRSTHEAFRVDVLAKAEAYNADIDQMKAAMRSAAKKMELDTDLDKLVHRLLTHDGAPIILYAKELRPRVRPGVKVLEKAFEDLFALRRDGRYVIRPDARARAEEMAQQFTQRSQLLEIVKRDVADFAKDVVESDEFHVRVKRALNDPMFVALVSKDLFEGRHVNRALAAGVVEQLEGAFREAGDGLIARDDKRAEIEKVLDNVDRVRNTTELLRAPMQHFADMLADEDETHRAWATMLRSEVGLVRISARVGYTTSDVGDTVREFLSKVLVEDDNGRLHAQPPEISEEKLIEGITQIFQQYRAARRRAYEADELSNRLSDSELGAALQSPGGKLALGEMLMARSERDVPDGFRQWVTENFTQTADGYVIRDDARGAIEEFVRQIAEVTQELKNADF